MTGGRARIQENKMRTLNREENGNTQAWEKARDQLEGIISDDFDPRGATRPAHERKQK